MTVLNVFISFLYNTLRPFLLLAYSLLIPFYALATIFGKNGHFKVSFLYIYHWGQAPLIGSEAFQTLREEHVA